MLFDTLLEDYSALNKEHPEDSALETHAHGGDGEEVEAKAKAKVSSCSLVLGCWGYF